MKIAIIGAGAAGLAAVLSDDFAAHNAKHAKWGKTTRCQKIGVVLCGGNVDLDALWSALERQAGISNK